jgi:molecular chaperone GrpE (heat shock protein)
MATFEELKILIEDTVFPDIEEVIDELFETIADQKEATMLQKEELQEMQALREEFQKVLEDIENNELSSEECDEIYHDVVEMIEEVDQD